MEKRFQKICKILVVITNFLADSAWEVYILGELCYTKTTMETSACDVRGCFESCSRAPNEGCSECLVLRWQ